MNRLRLTAAQISQPGGRAINEDACGSVDGGWVVADGLGGHGGGEVASKLAVEQVLAAAAQWLALMERVLLDRAPSDHDNYTGLAVFVDSGA